MNDLAANCSLAKMPIIHDARDVLRRLSSRPMCDLPLIRWPQELEEEDGGGVSVGLIDSGLAWKHPVFKGAQIEGRDFSGNHNLSDYTGHGTRNAALLVGQDPRYVRGLAPKCNLLVAKVSLRAGRSNGDVSITRAINWITYYGADFIIIPLGRGWGSCRVSGAIRRAIQSGCRIYAAAGNRGPYVLAFPASMGGVIAVSALNTQGQPIDWCCQSRKVKCYAPGEDIWSLGSTALSGSSPATVVAAGTAVLQLARHRRTDLDHTTC